MWASRFIALACAALAVIGCGGKSVRTVGGEAGAGSVCEDTLCNGDCVDTSSDEANCGSCGARCARNESCTRSRCTGGTSCDPPNQICNGECVDVRYSQNHCGGCDFSCGPNAQCSNGVCVTECPSGQCGTTCVDFSSDPSNCGGCGNVCSPSQVCSGGSCLFSCQGAFCNGVCVDLSTDPYNCGGCGQICIAPGLYCAQGSCQNLCPMGTLFCAGVCTDPRFDPQNCGSCGVSCPNGFSCNNAVCQSPCPSGTFCNGLCVNTSSDPSNCGGCGNACGATQCVNGMCAPTRCGNGIIDMGEEADPPPGPLMAVPVNPVTCRYDFSNIGQWYCNGTCGNWGGGQDCDQGDADAFCKLKLDNPRAIAAGGLGVGFQVTRLSADQQAPGVCCPPPSYPPGSLGCTSLGVLSSRGVGLNVSVHPSSLFSTHHEGNAITNLSCVIPP